MADTPTGRTWTLLVPAPYIKPVRKRKTGKMYQRRPWLNANDRDHWRVLHPIKKDWKANAADQAEIVDLPVGLARVRIDARINRATDIRSDAGNFYPTIKAIVDGLTEYGLTEDDSNEYVEGPYLHPGYKDLAPSVLITITELGTTDRCPDCDGKGTRYTPATDELIPCPACSGGEK